MAIRICPECSGKCTTTRNDCPHCGYVFPTKKVCPECGAEVDEGVKECPECGFRFEQAEETPKKKEEKDQKHANINCNSCGSAECEKLDDYTYKCKRCGSIIKLKRPDVHVTNINTYAGDAKTEDVPVYQIVKNFDEEEFIRQSILVLAEKKDVSPQILDDLKVAKEMVDCAYITYVEKEYSVDVTYSCEIGTDRKETYYENGNQKTRTVTDWRPFSGNGSDGGTTIFCAFGEETPIKSFTPCFMKSLDYEYVPFQESDKYPLKRRADKSQEESEKSDKISSLAYSCRRNLPGDHDRSFNYNGRCTFGDTLAYYYIPVFSLLTTANGKSVGFTSVASKKGPVAAVVNNSDISTVAEEKCPDEGVAKRKFRRTSYGVVSLIGLIMFPILLAISLIFGILFLSGWFAIPVAISLGCLIANAIIRKKTISRIYNNLLYTFKNKKLEACIRCLAKNNLPPLTDMEKRILL